MEMRNESPILAGQSERSWSIRSGSGSAPLADNPHIRLVIARDSQPKTSEEKALPSETVLAAGIRPIDLDENMRTASGEIKISRSILKAARSTGCLQLLPTWKYAKYLEITLDGDLRAVSRAGEVGIVIETVTEQHNECFLARLPSSIPTTTDWKHFTIADIAPSETRQGHVNAISVAFFPGPWQQVAGYGADKKCTDTLLRDLRLTVRASRIDSLAEKQLLFF